MRTRPLLVICLLSACFAGCGTTKWTDTSRTATEQLLISDAVDRSVSQLDLRALAGKTVYIDTKPLATVTDKDYVISTIRQHVLASGGILKDKPEDAEYIMEVRAGAVGTNRDDVLVGIPATTIPSTTLTAGVPATIPEVALAKKAEQHAVAKIYVFAYNRVTGRPVWQSGAVPAESKAKSYWVLGAGPFQSGSIYNGTQFLGDRVKIPLIDPGQKRDGVPVSIADEAYFVEPGTSPDKQIAREPSNPLTQAAPTKPDASKPAPGTEPSSRVIPAGHTSPPGNAGSPAAGASPGGTTNSPSGPANSLGGPVNPFGDPAPIPIPVTAAPPLGQPASLSPAMPNRSPVVPLPPVSPSSEAPAQRSLLDRLLLPQQ